MFKIADKNLVVDLKTVQVVFLFRLNTVVQNYNASSKCENISKSCSFHWSVIFCYHSTQGQKTALLRFAGLNAEKTGY